MTWIDYFTLVGVVPGRIVLPGHGTLDFSDDSLPVEKIRTLFEGGFHYLKVTPLGEDAFYQKPVLTVDQIGEIPLEDAPSAKKKLRKRCSLWFFIVFKLRFKPPKGGLCFGGQLR